MWTAIASIVGIIVGGFIQFYFSKHIDQQRHRREIRTKAYIDFLLCACNLVHQKYDRESDKGKELIAQTTDAKCRICLYGSSKVIDAFALFEKLGAATITDEQCNAFIDMISLMRKDSMNDMNLKDTSLNLVLFGKTER